MCFDRCMRIQFNNISFSEKVKIYKKDDNKVIEHYDENNHLIKSFVLDKYKRDIDSKHFDKDGNVIFHMHKEYSPNGMVETFKDKYQEYTRTIHIEIIDSMMHRIEEFCSKTSPKSNYVNEFIHDVSGKLVKIINNGKEIILKK